VESLSNTEFVLWMVHEPLALLGGMLSFYFVTRAVESSPAFKAFLRKMPSKTLFAVTSGILLFNAMMFLFFAPKAISLYFPGANLENDALIICLTQYQGVCHLIVGSLLLVNMKNRKMAYAMSMGSWCFAYGLLYTHLVSQGAIKGPMYGAGIPTVACLSWGAFWAVASVLFYAKHTEIPTASSTYGLNVLFVNCSVALISLATGVALMAFSIDSITLFFNMQNKAPASATALCFMIGASLFCVSGVVWTTTPSTKGNQVMASSFAVLSILFMIHMYVPVNDSKQSISQATGASAWLSQLLLMSSALLTLFYIDPARFF